MTSFDFTGQEKAFSRNRCLFLQGDSDQVMPYEAGAKWIEALVPSARLSTFEKAGRELYLTHAEKVIEEILGFVRGVGEHKSERWSGVLAQHNITLAYISCGSDARHKLLLRPSHHYRYPLRCLFVTSECAFND